MKHSGHGKAASKVGAALTEISFDDWRRNALLFPWLKPEVPRCQGGMRVPVIRIDVIHKRQPSLLSVFRNRQLRIHTCESSRRTGTY